MAQLIPAALYGGTGSVPELIGYGWYMTPELIVKKGVYIIDNDDSAGNSYKGGRCATVRDVFLTTYNTPVRTNLSGINGCYRSGICTLYFANFSFAAGTDKDSTTYQLPSQYRPCLTQDLLSVNNQVRFQIDTLGYITPVNAVSSATSIRGTFTFLTDYNQITS